MKMEIWVCVLGWFASILTMIGNGFVIFLVSSKRHLRSKTNAFIVSLAVADFLVGMHVFPSIFFLEVIGLSDQGLYIILLRLRWLFQDASVLSMCSLVLDRSLVLSRCETFKILNFYDFKTCYPTYFLLMGDLSSCYFTSVVSFG